MEWYDPAAITTDGGALRISLSQKETHDLHYQGGMMSTWNKFCFTDGLVEANVQLPGASNVVGLWPAVWTMGNLGRAGFGASLEGMVRFTSFAVSHFHSGRTHTMLAMWALRLTKLLMASL